MKALKILAMAALLTLAMVLAMGGCIIIHNHIGDTAVDAEAEVATAGYTVPTPKLVIPTE